MASNNNSDHEIIPDNEINSPSNLKFRFDKAAQLSVEGKRLANINRLREIAPLADENASGLRLGRPKKITNEQIIHALNECLAVLKDAAAYLGVTYQTLYNYIRDDKELSEAVKIAREQANDYVESKLLSRIRGYDAIEEKAFHFQGSIVKTTVVKHYPPDVTAIVEFLRARGKDRGYSNMTPEDKDVMKSFTEQIKSMNLERQGFKTVPLDSFADKVDAAKEVKLNKISEDDKEPEIND